MLENDDNTFDCYDFESPDTGNISVQTGDIIGVCETNTAKQLNIIGEVTSGNSLLQFRCSGCNRNQIPQRIGQGLQNSRTIHGVLHIHANVSIPSVSPSSTRSIMEHSASQTIRSPHSVNSQITSISIIIKPTSIITYPTSTEHTSTVAIRDRFCSNRPWNLKLVNKSELNVTDAVYNLGCIVNELEDEQLVEQTFSEV